jgi:hypothetical protein
MPKQFEEGINIAKLSKEKDFKVEISQLDKKLSLVKETASKQSNRMKNFENRLNKLDQNVKETATRSSNSPGKNAEKKLANLDAKYSQMESRTAKQNNKLTQIENTQEKLSRNLEDILGKTAMYEKEDEAIKAVQKNLNKYNSKINNISALQSKHTNRITNFENRQQNFDKKLAETLKKLKEVPVPKSDSDFVELLKVELGELKKDVCKIVQDSVAKSEKAEKKVIRLESELKEMKVMFLAILDAAEGSDDCSSGGGSGYAYTLKLLEEKMEAIVLDAADSYQDLVIVPRSDGDEIKSLKNQLQLEIARNDRLEERLKRLESGVGNVVKTDLKAEETIEKKREDAVVIKEEEAAKKLKKAAKNERKRLRKQEEEEEAKLKQKNKNDVMVVLDEKEASVSRPSSIASTLSSASSQPSKSKTSTSPSTESPGPSLSTVECASNLSYFEKAQLYLLNQVNQQNSSADSSKGI